MNYLKIANWSKWQTYRADRSQPPWIKLHRSLLRNPDWASLTDAEKGQLTSIWMLAADKDGKVPDCPEIIKKFCGLVGKVNLQVFIDCGFIEKRRQGDNHAATTCQPVDAKVTPQRRVEESRTDGPDGQAVLDYLNKITGKKLTYLDDIRACFKREGCTVEDCRLVINHKWAEWHGDPKSRKWMDATTPWRKANFRKYLDQAKANPIRTDGRTASGYYAY